MLLYFLSVGFRRFSVKILRGLSVGFVTEGLVRAVAAIN